MSPVNPFEDDPSPNAGLSLRSLVDLFRRHWKTILFSGLAAAVVAVVYLAVRAPTYTAHTELVVYNSRLGIGGSAAQVFPERSQHDPAFLETEMELLKSENIGLTVVDRLGLAAKAGSASHEGFSFRQFRRGVKSAILGVLPDLGVASPGNSSDRDPRQAALKQFKSNLAVGRVGVSYVVSVKYSDPDPEKAARVANETVRVYIEEQEAGRIEAAQSASPSLRERIRDLGPRTRVVAPASSPAEKSNPLALLVLLGATLAGLGLGSASRSSSSRAASRCVLSCRAVRRAVMCARITAAPSRCPSVDPSAPTASPMPAFS